MRILRVAKSKTSPKLGFDSNGWLIRNTCMIHLYLMQKQGKNTWTSDGCLGGDICREFQRWLGLKESSHCPTIHNNIYNFVKGNREIRI